MNYNEIGFREVYHTFCVFLLTEKLRDAVKRFPGAERADAILTYGYIDREAGVTMEILAVGNENPSGFDFYDTLDSVRSFIRIEAVAEDPLETLEVEAEELRERYADKLKILSSYDASEEVERTRRLVLLDESRHPFYPDDVKVFLMQDGMKTEGCWVRVTRLDEVWVKGELLNEPYQDFGWHEGEEIPFGFMETDNHKLICCAVPGMDEE